jgi:hypothetical protein
MTGLRAWVLCAPLVLVGVANLGAVSAAPPARSGLTWYRTWNEAQAVARAEGKLVLAASTRAGCGLCERFRSETAPQCSGQLSQVAVGYVYDIGRPEMGQVDHAIRSRLSGARLMPLVGFLTPDMEWVHGFWGGRTPQQFLGDIDHVRRVRPARVAAPPQRTPAPAPTVTSEPRANAAATSARLPATTQAPATQAPGAPLAARPTATQPPRAAAPSPGSTGAPAPRVAPSPSTSASGTSAPAAPVAPRAHAPAAAAPNLPAAPATPRPTGPLITRAPGGGQPAPLRQCLPNAPSSCPSYEEHCQGGVCDVPSIFEGPQCGPLPRSTVRRLLAGEPPACAPAARPAVPFPASPAPAAGVPDTAALRRAIPSATDGSPDGDAATPVARPVIARTFPPPTAPRPIQPAATSSASAPTGGGPVIGRVSSTLVRP